MGHHLRAIIGKPPSTEALAERFRAVVRVPLRQGFEMVPVVDQLHDEIALAPDASNPETAVSGFSRLGKRAERVLAELSEVAPVAYVYTEYFGGVGEQAAVAFVSGGVVTPHSEPGRVLPWSSTIGPINEALSAIGVAREGSHDEFDAVGLGQYRSMDDWEGENERLLRIWSRTRTECDAARDLLPPERPTLALGEIGTVQHYQEFVNENEWEMAIYCLERIGRDVSVPRRFWEHLLAAAEDIGLEEYAARFRARCGGGE